MAFDVFNARITAPPPEAPELLCRRASPPRITESTCLKMQARHKDEHGETCGVGCIGRAVAARKEVDASPLTSHEKIVALLNARGSVTINDVLRETALSYSTAYSALQTLVARKIIKARRGHGRCSTVYSAVV